MLDLCMPVYKSLTDTAWNAAVSGVADFRACKRKLYF